jgi:hypothetical protein
MAQNHRQVVVVLGLSRPNTICNWCIARDTVAAAVCEERKGYRDLIDSVGRVGGAMDRVSGARTDGAQDGAMDGEGKAEKRGSGRGVCVGKRRTSV